MTKAQINQIIVATISTVAAAVIIDFFRKRNPIAPPVTDNNKSWYR